MKIVEKYRQNHKLDSMLFAHGVFFDYYSFQYVYVLTVFGLRPQYTYPI